MARLTTQPHELLPSSTERPRLQSTGDVDLRQLRYFLTVAEERNFTRAAARLFMSQPPLSLQIMRLERELGVTLLERTARGVRLTPAGEVLYSRGSALVESLLDIIADVKRVGGAPGGLVRIGYPG